MTKPVDHPDLPLMPALPPTEAAPPAEPRAGGDADLARLMALGASLGYLTFDQVNEYLPDEAVDPE